jgi:hypothetical protein
MGTLLIAFLIAVFSKQAVDEFKAWTPWVVKKLVRFSVNRLPEDHRERYDEEWSSYVNEVPGEIGKVISAIGFVSASLAISHELDEAKEIANIYEPVKYSAGRAMQYTPGRLNFGLLPEPEDRSTPFIISSAVNGMSLLLAIIIVMTVRPQSEAKGIQPVSDGHVTNLPQPFIPGPHNVIVFRSASNPVSSTPSNPR